MITPDVNALPVWLQGVELNQWPTRAVHHDSLRCGLKLPQGWSLTGSRSATEATAEETHYQGAVLAESCALHYLADANPDDALQAWVESPLALTGFPLSGMIGRLDGPARVLEMSYYGDFDAYRERLGCDEMHAYDGLAELPQAAGGLTHCYILALRRGTQAWKIDLSFMSACLPGTPEDILARNDHVRAGSSLGFLELSGQSKEA